MTFWAGFCEIEGLISLICATMETSCLLLSLSTLKAISPHLIACHFYRSFKPNYDLICSKNLPWA